MVSIRESIATNMLAMLPTGEDNPILSFGLSLLSLYHLPEQRSLTLPSLYLSFFTKLDE
jgi:hypothetical protein